MQARRIALYALVVLLTAGLIFLFFMLLKDDSPDGDPKKNPPHGTPPIPPPIPYGEEREKYPFIGIEKNPALRRQITEMRERGCLQHVVDQEWLGVAPFCEEDASSCAQLQPSGDWHYIRSEKTGNGAPCWTGNKVLCARAKCVADNPEYQDSVSSWWTGTAPTCGANQCDCVTQYGAVPWRQGKCGDGACCVTGSKQLCLRPNKPDSKMNKWVGDAAAQCAKDHEINQKLRQDGVEIVKEVVKQIPKFIKAGNPFA